MQWPSTWSLHSHVSEQHCAREPNNASLSLRDMLRKTGSACLNEQRCSYCSTDARSAVRRFCLQRSAILNLAKCSEHPPQRTTCRIRRCDSCPGLSVPIERDLSLARLRDGMRLQRPKSPQRRINQEYRNTVKTKIRENDSLAAREILVSPEIMHHQFRLIPLSDQTNSHCS